MKVEFKSSFVKDLARVRDRSPKERVKRLIERLEEASTLQKISNVTKLRGADRYYRVRIGDYRLGLAMEGETVTLIRFLHRKDLYRYFP